MRFRFALNVASSKPETVPNLFIPQHPVTPKHLFLDNLSYMIENLLVSKFYLQVYGCQMNQYEAELVRHILNQSGFSETDNAEDADVFLMVTCSVRDHAEQRALGRLATFKSYKNRSSEKIVGVLGCAAQRLNEKLITDYGADIVVGPDGYRHLPELINRRRNGAPPQLFVPINDECYPDIHPQIRNAVTANVTIMRGCNNFCSYCIVPYVKGPERSRPVESIVNEVEQLVRAGVKEVTLLGQNVLAYQDRETSFTELLATVCTIDGIERVRFLTSHPRDLTEKIIDRIARLPKVCPQFHLPLQSGSNRILQLMNRGYTREEYMEKVQLLRDKIPEVSITTDIIVGFPTEDEDDFAATLETVRAVKFDFAYMFKYSPRPGTRAAAIQPAVPEAIARRRLTELIKLQNQITRNANQALVGKTCELLIEGPSPRGQGSLGRTRQGKVVILDEEIPPGTLVSTMVKAVRGWTPIGQVRNTIQALVTGGC
jgi:tRNA-2-methylthio-N6-dimethylallyladenosine synthase